MLRASAHPRTDSAGASHEFLNWPTNQRLSYSVGFGLPSDSADMVNRHAREGLDPGAMGPAFPSVSRAQTRMILKRHFNPDSGWLPVVNPCESVFCAWCEF